jgi:nucleotide-binding universal stress UspA family protein
MSGAVSSNEGEAMSMIVVGVDHSAGAKAALRFALQEARLRRATLRVVHAWQFGYIGAPGIEAGSTMVGAELEELRHGAEAALEATLREAIPDTDGVKLDRRVVEGPAAPVLVEESHGADLLVVGSRGLGGFRGLLLGSVGQQCAHHAGCPVVIVPHPREAMSEG